MFKSKWLDLGIPLIGKTTVLEQPWLNSFELWALLPTYVACYWLSWHTYTHLRNSLFSESLLTIYHPDFCLKFDQII